MKPFGRATLWVAFWALVLGVVLLGLAVGLFGPLPEDFFPSPGDAYILFLVAAAFFLLFSAIAPYGSWWVKFLAGIALVSFLIGMATGLLNLPWPGLLLSLVWAAEIAVYLVVGEIQWRRVLKGAMRIVAAGQTYEIRPHINGLWLVHRVQEPEYKNLGLLRLKRRIRVGGLLLLGNSSPLEEHRIGPITSVEPLRMGEWEGD